MYNTALSLFLLIINSRIELAFKNTVGGAVSGRKHARYEVQTNLLGELSSSDLQPHPSSRKCVDSLV